MSFEMKYDRDGNPIKNTALEQQPPVEEPVVQAAPEPEAPPVQEQEESEETVPLAAEQEETLEKIVAPEEEEPKKSDVAKNFREIREAKMRAERERDEYMRRVAELEAKIAPVKPVPVEEDEEEIAIGDDDLAEGKHLSKINKQIRKLKQELKQYKSQNQEQTTESRLKAQYADFDKVVSRENVEALQAAYPELGRTVMANDDLYSKAVAAYTLIKKFGIYQEKPFNSEKAVAAKNNNKPRPLVSVSPQQGESPLSRANAFANGLTEDLKKELFQEMSSARKGY